MRVQDVFAEDPEAAFWAEGSEGSVESADVLEIEEAFCCRMLGLVNGRDEFALSGSLKWGDGDSLVMPSE